MNPFTTVLRHVAKTGLLLPAFLLAWPFMAEAEVDWDAPHVPKQLIIGVRSGLGTAAMWSSPPYSALAVNNEAVPAVFQGRFASAGVLELAPLLPDAVQSMGDSATSEEFATALLEFDPTRYFLASVDSTVALQAAADSIAADTNVVFVEPNYYLSLEATPNDSRFTSQWNLGTASGGGINIASAWDIQTGNSAIKIGIPDTGADNENLDLGAGQVGYSYLKLKNFHDFTNESNTTPYDGHYHGTAMASLAAGWTNNSQDIAGVAGGWVTSSNGSTGNSGCKVIPVKIDQTDADPDVVNACNALMYLCNPSTRADVILTAWGKSVKSRALANALYFVAGQRVLVVAAKGNEDVNNDVTPHYPSDYVRGRWTLSVGATNASKVRAAYPMAGWLYGTGSNRGGGIDVCAPGVSVWSGTPANATSYMITQSVSTYASQFSGTSVAAAQAAGVAALVQSEALDDSVTLHPDDVQGIIKASALRLVGGSGYSSEFGWGLLDARAAIDMMRTPWVMNHFSVTGGTPGSEDAEWRSVYVNVPNPAGGPYYVKATPVQITVPINTTYSGTPYVWTRGVSASYGWSDEDGDLYGDGTCKVVSQTSTSVTLETKIYRFRRLGQILAGYYPTDASHVVFAYTVLGVPADTTLPATVTDLAVAEQGRTSLRLSWTDTGDDGVDGTASAYDFRYSSSPISNNSLFNSAAPVPVDLGDPSEAGAERCVVVDGLSPSHTYYFALKLEDENGNWSGLNASVSGSTLGGTHYEEVGDCPIASRPSRSHSQVQPLFWALDAARPNPSASGATIDYTVKVTEQVAMRIYTVTGRLVRTLVNGVQPAGRHSVTWDGKSEAGARLPSGVYFYEMQAPGWSQHRRLVVVASE